MHAHVLITVIIVHITTISASCPPSQPDPYQVPEYYWKDYIGVVPEDAVKGGTDEYGNSTYVGQAYIKEYELLPGIISSGCKTVRTTAYTKEVTIDNNIKILCAKDTRKFEWVPTKKEDLHLLIGRHLVGGSEVGHTLYIGRVNYNNKIIIGKFFTSTPLSTFGIAVPYQGKPINFDSFEVLTYNKHMDEIHQVWDIAPRSQPN